MGDYNSDDGSGWAETENPLENLVQTSESSMLNNVVSLKNVISLTVSEATTSDDVSSDGPSIGYIISDENKWGWITLYVVTIVVAVLGNLLFIIGSLCTRRSRNTGHYLLINLSIRDILLAGLCIPATLDSEIIHLTWNLGLEFCISFRWAFSSAYQLISFTLDCQNFVCFVLFCSLLMIIRKSLCQPMWLIASLIKQMFYLEICGKKFYQDCFRYFYYCFLFFLPLTALFLGYHLFVENAKWAQSEDVPRPWPHTIYIPLIWFFSALFAVPTAFFSELRPWTDDPYKNEIAGRPESAQVCMHSSKEWGKDPSIYFYLASFLFTFVLPLVLLVIPWFALVIQSAGCCTRRLRSSDFWLSLITIFLILIFEASRAPFELFNVQYVLTNWELESLLPIQEILPLGESYIAVMKWAVYAPAMVHPILYFTFCADARHGVRILFGRLCACCYSKAGDDIETASGSYF